MKQAKQFKILTRMLLILIMVTVFSYLNYGKSEKNSRGDTVITFNYLTDDPREILEGKYVADYGKNVLFLVKDVNPFLFKVTIKGEPFDYFSDTPSGFNLITPKEAAQSSSTKAKDTLEAMGTGIKEKDYSLWEKFKPEKSECEKSIDEFILSYGNLPRVIEFNNALRSVLLRNKTFEAIQQDANRLLKSYWPGVELERAAAKFTAWFDDAYKKYQVIDFQWLEKYKVDSDYFKKLARVVDVFKKDMDSMKSDKVIESIDGMIRKLDPTNFQRSILIPTVDADDIQFTLKIEALDSKNSTVHREVSGIVHVRVKGGWAINFSTGLLAGIDPWTHGYRLETVADEPGKVKIIEDNKTSLNPSVAVLMHAYPRRAGSSSWSGITFGIGTKDTERISYYLGSGIIFGVKQRFILNAGLMLTKVDVLKPEYKVGQVLEQNDELKAENLVQSEFKPRFFIGISYNLIKKAK